MRYREGQSEYFAKKGISWHVTVVSTVPLNKVSDEDDDEEEDEESCDNNNDEEDLSVMKRLTKFNCTVYVHVFDQVVQDSEAVLTILQDILVKIKSVDPAVENAFLRFDNAGCYHSAQTILSMSEISRTSGSTSNGSDFSDPQGGKGTWLYILMQPRNPGCLIVFTSWRAKHLAKSGFRMVFSQNMRE